MYIFNLIVGTGALTLPSVFNRAGWAVGIALVLVLAFMRFVFNYTVIIKTKFSRSFVTMTFVVESMAAANAVCRWRRKQERVTNK